MKQTERDDYFATGAWGEYQRVEHAELRRDDSGRWSLAVESRPDAAREPRRFRV